MNLIVKLSLKSLAKFSSEVVMGNFNFAAFLLSFTREMNYRVSMVTEVLIYQFSLLTYQRHFEQLCALQCYPELPECQFSMIFFAINVCLRLLNH